MSNLSAYTKALISVMESDDWFEPQKEHYGVSFEDVHEVWSKYRPSIIHKENKVLTLVLSYKPFEVMLSGEKGIEYRKPTDWIKSRLFDKQGNKREYDFIKFQHAYMKNAPYFICEFVDFTEYTFFDSGERNFSNGLSVKIEKGDYLIYFNEILYRENV